MSWFNDLSSKVGELSNKVQAAIPIDRAMIEKLTLTTPEMTAERQRFEQEETRKAQAKDSLAGMLPWETRDAEREILVDECKEAILALSDKDETFLGPYLMPALPNTGTEVEKTETEEEEEEEGVEEEEPGPSEESLEKLAKLEPLPPLLAEFDLDSHVGLIQRLLKIDSKLVEKQSRLSGAGSREHFFWKNYFFHCAYTRYEAGLSIDEIWSDEPVAPSSETPNAENEEQHHEDEQTITFETLENENESVSSSTTPKASLFDSNAATPQEDMVHPVGSASSASNEGADYDMVDDAAEDDDAELDELEAEIARELED